MYDAFDSLVSNVLNKVVEHCMPSVEGGPEIVVAFWGGDPHVGQRAW